MNEKIIKTYGRVGVVYFPDTPAFSRTVQRQRWLRARGFRSLMEDADGFRTLERWEPGTPPKLVHIARLNVLTSKRRIVEAFKGAAIAETARIKADTLLAAYDLLWEQFVACGFHQSSKFHDVGKIKRPEMILKTTRRGRAVWGCGERYFTIPEHAVNRSEEYAIYYVAHELAHHAKGGMSHGPAMCQVEAALLNPFDIAIEYKGGRGSNEPWYPKRLIRKSTGDVVHERKVA